MAVAVAVAGAAAAAVALVEDVGCGLATAVAAEGRRKVWVAPLGRRVLEGEDSDQR